MPRYRFHLYNDIQVIDEQGRDFPDLAAAIAEAFADARKIMGEDLGTKGKINLNHWIELEDEAGQITVIPFRDAVTITS